MAVSCGDDLMMYTWPFGIDEEKPILANAICQPCGNAKRYADGRKYELRDLPSGSSKCIAQVRWGK